MKDKVNRLIATGLIALMISNFTACDQVDIIDDLGLKDDNITSSIDKDVNKEDTSFASGSVWEALKQYPAITLREYPYAPTELKGKPIPITFLLEEGVLAYDHLKDLYFPLADKSAYEEPSISTQAFVDDNSPENDVYLIMQYRSDKIISNTSNKDVYLATWQLKYSLDDDDYQTFLKLKGDWRILLFIQEMDKQYQPEVISKTIVSYDLLDVGSHVRNEDRFSNGFPYIFVSGIDYDNQIMTFGGLFGEEIRYIDVDMRKTDAWDVVVSRDGLTEEEREESISMYSKETPLGMCLINFHINNIQAILKPDQAKKAFENTDNIAYLTQMYINSQKNVYKYEDFIK